MKSKLDKLNELSELLKSGTITQDEFNKLKKEVLNLGIHNIKKSNDNSITKTESNQVKKELKKESISTHNKKTPGIDKPLKENEKRILKKDQETLLFIRPIIAVMVLLAAFGFYKNYDSSDNKKTNNSSSYSTKSKTDESNTPPSGYKKGGTCRDCSGTGKYLYDGPFGVVKEGAICAGCNGKGYHWVKK